MDAGSSWKDDQYGCNEQVFSQAEQARDKQAKPWAEPSIMIFSTSIYEHHTILYEHYNMYFNFHSF